MPFFKACWEIIEFNMFKGIIEFFFSAHLPKVFSPDFIALILNNHNSQGSWRLPSYLFYMIDLQDHLKISYLEIDEGY